MGGPSVCLDPAPAPVGNIISFLVKIANLQPFWFKLFTLLKKKNQGESQGGLFIWVKSITPSYSTSKLTNVYMLMKSSIYISL